MISHIVQILSYKNTYVSVRTSICSILNAFFSATSLLILTKFGTKVSIDSGFMNPKN